MKAPRLNNALNSKPLQGRPWFQELVSTGSLSRLYTREQRREKRIRAAKRAVRSELSVSGGEWQKNGYADNPDVLSVHGIGKAEEKVQVEHISLTPPRVVESMLVFQLVESACLSSDWFSNVNVTPLPTHRAGSAPREREGDHA